MEKTLGSVQCGTKLNQACMYSESRYNSDIVMIKSLILDGLKTRVEGRVMRISVGYRASGLQLASAPPSVNLPDEKRGEQRASPFQLS